MKSIAEILASEFTNNLYWIRVDYIYQPGRENLSLKPKAITEGYLIVPDEKLQYAIQVCDWDSIIPEALWIGSYNQAIQVVAEYKKFVEIRCSILPIPPCLVVHKFDKIQLNFSRRRNFMDEVMMNQPKFVPVTEKTEEPLGDKLGQEEDTGKGNGNFSLDYTLSHYLLNTATVKKIIQSKNLKRLYINIFYKREINDPPLMENVLDYKAIFARFAPKLPEGWRYMCKLSTYAQQLSNRLKNIAEKSWGIPWSDEILDDMLNDEYIFTEVTIEVLNTIIFESELMGNELHITEEIAYGKF